MRALVACMPLLLPIALCGTNPAAAIASSVGSRATMQPISQVPIPPELRAKLDRLFAPDGVRRCDAGTHCASTAAALATDSVFVAPQPLAWLEQKLTADDAAANNYFGYAIGLTGDTAFVGAAVANDQKGAVYVFTHNAGSWTQTQQIVAADGVAGDGFGGSIAVSGSTLLIGANTAATGSGALGVAYVFSNDGGSWSQTQRISADDGASAIFFGSAVALQGTTAIITAPQAAVDDVASRGAAYVFAYDGTHWTQTQKIYSDDGQSYEGFGGWVALSGSTAMVGVSDANVGDNLRQGAAYVFENSGGSWSQTQKLTADDGAANELFGVPVALDGDTALVAESEAVIDGNTAQGAVYEFRRTDGVWSQTQKFVGADSVAGEGFGASIALQGNRAVIGANQYYSQGSGVGYVFSKASGAWAQTAKLAPSDGLSMDNFGVSALIDGNTILIGASVADVDGNAGQGAAYIYTDDTIFANGFD